MSYEKLNYSNAVKTIKRGGIYVCCVDRITKAALGGDITKMIPKNNLSAIGSISIRPVLVLREPEEWDCYRTVGIIPSTTRDQPKYDIPRSSFFDAETNPQYDTFSFKIHDYRSVDAISLYKYCGSIPDKDLRLISIIFDSFHNLNSWNVVRILRDLKLAMNAYPEHIVDLRALYLRAYNKYPFEVMEQDPELKPTYKLTEYIPKQVHLVSIASPRASDGNRTMVPNIMDEENEAEQEVLAAISSPPVEDIKEAAEILNTAHAPIGQTIPADTIQDDETIDEVTDNEEEEEEEVITIQEEVEIPEPVQNEARTDLVFNIFLPSKTYRSYRPKNIIKRKMSDNLVVDLCITGFITRQYASARLGISYYRLKKQMEFREERVVYGLDEPYTLDDEYYGSFKCWMGSRFRENKSKYFQDTLLECIYPAICENMTDVLHSKLSFKEGHKDALFKAFGTREYNSLPAPVRECYKNLTPADIYEIIPSIPTSQLMGLVRMTVSNAKTLKTLCLLAKSISYLDYPAPEANCEIHENNEEVSDASSDEKVETDPSSYNEAVCRNTLKRISKYLRPGNMKNMPKAYRNMFIAIPKDVIKDYIENDLGYSTEDFSMEYRTCIKFFETLGVQ